MNKNLSTFSIAKMLKVDPGSVANWIDQNLLKAHRTPGGHRRVLAEDLIVFLRKQKMPIPDSLQAAPTRVLVVDDEQAVAQMIVRAIRQTYPQFEIAEAYDGFHAGALLATLNPDLIILDLRMPGMDGYEVCRMVKSQMAHKHMEILAMTAYPSPENERKILECGARICLSKPLNIDILMKEIQASI